jgi:NADP-dependent 3-hydroxy acid dehydrogenase YdfG
VKSSYEIFENIDIILNNAGVFEKRKDEYIDTEKPQAFLNTTNECWHCMLNINVMGTVHRKLLLTM